MSPNASKYVKIFNNSANPQLLGPFLPYSVRKRPNQYCGNSFSSIQVAPDLNREQSSPQSALVSSTEIPMENILFVTLTTLALISLLPSGFGAEMKHVDDFKAAA